MSLCQGETKSAAKILGDYNHEMLPECFLPLRRTRPENDFALCTVMCCGYFAVTHVLRPPPSDFLDPPLKGAVNQRPGPYTLTQWTGSGLGEGLGGRVSLTREVHRCLAECLRSHLKEIAKQTKPQDDPSPLFSTSGMRENTGPLTLKSKLYLNL